MAIDKNSNKKAKANKAPAKNKKTPKKSKHKNKKKRNRFGTILKRTFLTLLFLCLIAVVIAGGYIFAVIKSTPDLDINEVTNLSQPTSLYDDKGEFMDTLHSEINRTVVGYDKIPDNLKNAYISIEDERFMTHSGIDIRRIAGSLVTDIQKIFVGQTNFHGGSTITQQLLKNTILTNENSNIERKIKEIYYALQLEKQLSKDEILNQYLNTIPLGGTAYGVEAASKLYFGKSVQDLSLIECAYIAGITQAPTYYSAYNEKNKNDPSSYINRTKTVLSKMKELNKISDEEYNKAISDIDNGGLQFKSAKEDYSLQYEWYINPAISQVKEDLKKKYKYTDEEVSKLLANGGLKIHTNMNRELQDYTQDVLDKYSSTNVGYQETTIAGTNTPEFQASATIVDYKTGKVLAMIGGRGQHDALTANRAYDVLKPIGSTTKPLTVYGPAINEKILTAASTIDDSPIPDSIAKQYGYTKSSETGEYLSNDDRQFSGNIALRDGLRQSKNVASVLVENQLGLKTGVSYGEKVGLKYNDVSKTSMSAVALGEFDNANGSDGGNTFITSSAFGIFGNNGLYTTPKLYSQVIDASGNSILDAEVETKQILSPEAAYITYDILKGSCEYTGPNAKWGSMPVAGKTGTTTGRRNLWFTGITPYLSGSIWIGYDTPKELHTSSNSAAGLWGKIMAKAHENMAVTDIDKPSGIVEAEVCKDSGKLATDLCRSDVRPDSGSRVYTEMFIEGTEPTSYCENHVKVSINSSNGKLANANTPEGLKVDRVAVQKANANSKCADYKYIVPTEQDDMVATPSESTPEAEEENPDGSDSTDTSNQDNDDKNNPENPDTGGSTSKPDNDKDEDKDKDKDKNKKV
ncbi:MAG: transglycosylase domain-containing protein [Clostridiaceae bacterium]|nr:transglycosylase domain-containing protein [Clostridiaceae bacterium]